jgi:hypothetical protein
VSEVTGDEKKGEEEEQSRQKEGEPGIYTLRKAVAALESVC